MSYRYFKPKSFHVGRHLIVSCGSTRQLKAYGPNFSDLDLKVLKRRTNKRQSNDKVEIRKFTFNLNPRVIFSFKKSGNEEMNIENVSNLNYLS